jgi:hypothetical protein
MKLTLLDMELALNGLGVQEDVARWLLLDQELALDAVGWKMSSASLFSTWNSSTTA